MSRNHGVPSLLVGIFLLLVGTSCTSLHPASPTATATPEATIAPSSTPTFAPTATLMPTPTPNAIATLQALDLQARIQRYLQNGYLTTDQGLFTPLQDNTIALAKMDYVDFRDAGYKPKVQNFAAWSHIKLGSAAPVNYPEYSGCGFAFREDDKGGAYAAMISKDRVLMAVCRNGSCREVGKTRGSGVVGYSDVFEADFELIVNDLQAVVLVDGQFIGEYSLSTDFLTQPGAFGYSIISGTNRDYGTQCEFNNSGIWLSGQPSGGTQSR